MGILQVLRHISLFHGLPTEHIQTLARHAREKAYRPGQLIIIDAEETQALYIVVWGTVKIYKSSSDGKEQTIFHFGPGEPFCLTALTDEFSPASAMALEDTRILFFPAHVLEEVARQEPSLLFNLLLVVSRRLKESLMLIESLSLKELPQRLATFLIRTLEHEGNRTVLELGFTQRELAKIMGVTPEALSRVFKKLNTDGILRAEGRTITVFDHDALEELSEGGR